MGQELYSTKKGNKFKFEEAGPSWTGQNYLLLAHWHCYSNSCCHVYLEVQKFKLLPPTIPNEETIQTF